MTDRTFYYLQKLKIQKILVYDVVSSKEEENTFNGSQVYQDLQR